MDKIKLINYLNEYLKISDFKDSSKNGLQIDCEKTQINKIGYAVDATTYVYDLAKQNNVDLIITHHGNYWGFEQTLTGVPYQRAKKLIDANIGLYACHLPLDAHPEVGNNIGLIKAFVNIFGIQEYDLEPFGHYEGSDIGFGIIFKDKVHISTLISMFGDRMGLKKHLYNFGNKEYIGSVCVVSGGGMDGIQEANDKGYDLFITGEGAHYQHTLAKELGQSVYVAGHRETEKIGVKLLCNHIKKEFDLDVMFLDAKY